MKRRNKVNKIKPKSHGQRLIDKAASEGSQRKITSKVASELYEKASAKGKKTDINDCNKLFACC